MKVVLAKANADTSTIDVPDDITVEALITLAQEETGFHSAVLMHNGQDLSSDKSKTLAQAGVQDGDVVMVQSAPAPLSDVLRGIDFSSIQIPSTSAGPRPGASSTAQPHSQGLDSSEAASVHAQLANDPHSMSLLRERNPPLAAALEKGNLVEIQALLDFQRETELEAERLFIRAMNADDFDAEAQKFIEDRIQQENLDDQLDHAMEHAPEVFGSVCMLYINAKVNNHPVKAFVDSGAESTIISSHFAERCSIMRMVDKRFSGIAHGVGTQKIIGKIHLAQLQIEDAFLPTSFIVLEDQTMDMLLGLDMLKRHQCLIDLQKHELRIGTPGTSTRFLAESELPAHAKMHLTPDEEMELVHDAAASDPSQGGDMSFPEESIKRMVEMGFARDLVMKALRETEGNVERAIANLVWNGE